MGQFDSRTDAVQSRFEAEERESGLVRHVSGGFLDLASLFLEFVGDKNVAFASKSALGFLKYLAGQRSEENVRYLLDAVADDLRDLINKVNGQEEKIKEIRSAVKADRFSELLTEAAVQATRTSSQKRIKRLAHVVVSGAIEFQTKSLDATVDFERHCIELTDADILLLKFLADRQPDMGGPNFQEGPWAEQIRIGWINLPHTSGGGYIGITAIDARSSFSRLQSRGLICQLSWGNISAGNGSDPYGVLEEGRAFLKFLREAN